MVNTSVHHPIFARVFGRLSHVMEREIGRYREELLAGLSGRVLEVGAGNGMNFRHYPGTVEEVVALEPEPYLRRLAAATAEGVGVSVEVRDGVAEQLEGVVPERSFDAVVFSLVLCSVNDVPAALAAAGTALRPGGELRFFEHVRSSDVRRARVQSLADRSRLWPLISGGCHCARDTAAAIGRAGFEIERLREFSHPPELALTNPVILGRARLA